MNNKNQYSSGQIDIVAMFKDTVIGSIDTIKYKISRERPPILSLGGVIPIGFARGKTTITGSMTFIQFDSYELMRELRTPEDEKQRHYFIEDLDDLRPEYNKEQKSYLVMPWYADQIPPFDIMLTAANEYGDLGIMKILGVELLHSGSGVSIDDVVSEHSFNYVAQEISPWETQTSSLPRSIIPQDESHEGKIYNPYTDRWTWL